MALKLEFARLLQAPDANIRDLCRRFRTSPTTAYRLKELFAAQGAAGLAERSRRPHSSPVRTAPDMARRVLEVREAHPAWGARKIAAVLRRRGVEGVPALSTITKILRRNGVELGLLSGMQPPARQRFERAEPNELWQMDYKGHVPMARGRLHPLTVLDDHSRFNVVLAACAGEQGETVKTHLTAAFERYGMPVRMLTDNGAPWGSVGELTKLSVWLLEHDVAVSNARPSHPQTLGKDERFHRSLKAEALQGRVFLDLRQAQTALDKFRADYNCERPHEGIGLQTPVSRYRPSPRAYDPAVRPFEYGPDDAVRRVDVNGRASFKGCEVRVSKALDGKQAAFRPTQTDGVYDIVFRSKTIKTIDLNDLDR